MTALLDASPAARLLDRPGIEPVTAANAYAAWSPPGRIRSEAAFASLTGVNPIPASSETPYAIASTATVIRDSTAPFTWPSSPGFAWTPRRVPMSRSARRRMHHPRDPTLTQALPCTPSLQAAQRHEQPYSRRLTSMGIQQPTRSAPPKRPRLPQPRLLPTPLTTALRQPHGPHPHRCTLKPEEPVNLRQCLSTPCLYAHRPPRMVEIFGSHRDAAFRGIDIPSTTE